MKKNETHKQKAVTRLKQAILQLRQNNYIWSITFAREANQILSKIAKKRAGFDAVSKYIELLDQAAKRLAEKRKKNKHITEIIDKIRSGLKRPEERETLVLNKDLENEALGIIDKAILNYQIAYGGDPEDLTIKNHMRYPHLTPELSLRKKKPGP